MNTATWHHDHTPGIYVSVSHHSGHLWVSQHTGPLITDYWSTATPGLRARSWGLISGLSWFWVMQPVYPALYTRTVVTVHCTHLQATHVNSTALYTTNNTDWSHWDSQTTGHVPRIFMPQIMMITALGNKKEITHSLYIFMTPIKVQKSDKY